MTDTLWSQRAEQCVLGTLMAYPATWNECADVITTPDLFYDRNHRLIAWALIQRARNGDSIEVMAMFDALAQIPFADAVRAMDDGVVVLPRADMDPSDSVLAAVGASVLSGLTEHAAKHRIKGAATAIVSHYKQRRLADELKKALEKLTGTGGRDQAPAIVDTLVNEASRVIGGHYAAQRIGEALADAITVHDQAKLQGSAAVGLWGLESMDKHIPLRQGKLIVLAAPPGAGKTSLALQSIMRTWTEFDSDSAAIVSLEMESWELASILAGAQIGVSRSAIEAGELTDSQRAEIVAIQAEWEKRGSGPLIKTGGEPTTINDVCTWVRQRYHRSGGKLKYVCVDHIGLLEKENPKQTDYDKLSSASDKLKKLCNSLRICVLCLSQMNRDSRQWRNKDGSAGAMPEPQMGCLKGSGDIEEDADAVVVLWERSTVSYDTATITAVAVKQRNGPRARIDLTFHKANGQKFEEQTGVKRVGNVKMFDAPKDEEDIL